MSYWKLISSFDPSRAIDALNKTSLWEESEPGYYNLPGEKWPEAVRDLAEEASGLLGSFGKSRAQVSKGDGDFVGILHADYDAYNTYDPTIGHNRIFEDYGGRIDRPWGNLRFILFLNSSDMRVEINKEIIRPRPGELFWIEHYAPHWFINESGNSRYQIMLDIDTKILSPGQA